MPDQGAWPRWFTRPGALAFTLLSVALAGCGLGEQVETFTPNTETIPASAVNGNVHGGVYPIVGAKISLMQTVTNAAYTNAQGVAVPASTYGSAAKTLLTATSDANGNFNFANGWPCATNEFAYLVVTGGHTSNLPAGSVNNSVIQVGVVGPCSSLATAAQQAPVNVFLSEVSTVASAAALGNFMSISPNDGSGTQVVNIGAPLKNSTAGNCPSGSTCASGLEHGFTNAATLVNSISLSGATLTGQGNLTNPLSSTASSIPAALLNTIGNIMQGCVDSAGGSSFCTSLFSAASAPGATVPANTLQAALNIVQNPGNNVTNLYKLQLPNAPFLPDLGTAPTSFAISIFYGVTYNGSTGASLNQFPTDIALDASDNAWVLYADKRTGIATYSAIDEWLANGTHKQTGTPNTTYTYPAQIAIDPSGNVFATNNDTLNYSNDTILQWNAGTLRAPAVYGYTYQGITGLAINGSGRLFVSSIAPSSGNVPSIVEATVSGSGNSLLVLPAGETSYVGPIAGLAIDTAGNVWGTGASTAGTVQATLWPNNNGNYGTLTAAAFTGASAPTFVAAGAGTTSYFPMKNQLMSATYSGSALSTNSAVATATGAAIPYRSEVDGSGRVFWTDLESTGTVNYYTAGLSSPVSTFLPCFAVPAGSTSYNCLTAAGNNATPAYLRGMAIDSAGNMWYVADSGYGAIIETLGVAAPTWPLLSYAHPGVKPQ